jgi:DNA-binding winged helix-turn-helix (wHTH) protein
MALALKVAAVAPPEDEADRPARCPCCGAPVDPLEILVDEPSGVVVRHGRAARLRPQEVQIFSILLSHHPAAVMCDALFAALYGARADGGPDNDKIFAVYAVRLRRALAPLSLGVENVYGRGYRLVDGASPAWRDDSALRREPRLAGADVVADVQRRGLAGESESSLARASGLTYRAVRAILDQARGAR